MRKNQKGFQMNWNPFFKFARHGRALTGESPEYAQVVGNVKAQRIRILSVQDFVRMNRISK